MRNAHPTPPPRHFHEEKSTTNMILTKFKPSSRNWSVVEITFASLRIPLLSSHESFLHVYSITFVMHVCRRSVDDSIYTRHRYISTVWYPRRWPFWRKGWGQDVSVWWLQVIVVFPSRYFIWWLWSSIEANSWHSLKLLSTHIFLRGGTVTKLWQRI